MSHILRSSRLDYLISRAHRISHLFKLPDTFYVCLAVRISGDSLAIAHVWVSSQLQIQIQM